MKYRFAPLGVPMTALDEVLEKHQDQGWEIFACAGDVPAAGPGGVPVLIIKFILRIPSDHVETELDRTNKAGQKNAGRIITLENGKFPHG